MAVKRVAAVARTRRVAPVEIDPTPSFDELRTSLGARKSMWDKFGPVVMIVVVVMAFALGAMWNKIKNLEAGGSPTAVGAAAGAGPVAKYASFKKAADTFAKDLGLDVSKLDACVNSGSQVSAVDAEEAEGQGVGVQGTPGFFINGRFIGGAFPFAAFKEVIDMELAGKGSDDIKSYSQTLQGAAAQQAFNPVPKQITVGNAPSKGPKDAKVVMVEYSDFQCPYCESAYQTLKQVLAEYGDKILFVYKQYPLKQIHPNAEKASEVAMCAKDQGKFWEMHDKLFDTQKDWSSAPSGWN